jgi:hypothetical protein
VSEIVTRLRDRRLNVWNQAKEIADRAAEENRNFSPEEQGQWDGLNGELDKLDARIKSAIETEQRSKDQDEAFNRLQGKPQERGGQQDSKGSTELRAEDHRAFLRRDRH